MRDPFVGSIIAVLIVFLGGWGIGWGMARDGYIEETLPPEWCVKTVMTVAHQEGAFVGKTEAELQIMLDDVRQGCRENWQDFLDWVEEAEQRQAASSEP